MEKTAKPEITAYGEDSVYPVNLLFIIYGARLKNCLPINANKSFRTKYKRIVKLRFPLYPPVAVLFSICKGLPC